jgi:dienelactone hydrolase
VHGEFVGVFEAPRGGECGSAVVLLGGSEGGLATEHVRLARDLADRGVGALALAYFGLPGLPPDLAGIRLEYFADALSWLADQTGLGAESTVMWGASRGSEAALLSAVHFPELVHHVVALVPGNVVLAGWPLGSGPAWMLDGSPLPHSSHFGPDAVDERALIPVERITGRVLLAGAGADRAWPSAEMARAIRTRRGEHRHGDVLGNYPDADHGLGRVGPHRDATADHGPTTRARAHLWPEVVAFLEGIAAKRSGGTH